MFKRDSKIYKLLEDKLKSWIWYCKYNSVCRPRQLSKWSEWLWAGNFEIESEECSSLLPCPSPKQVAKWRSTISLMQYLKRLRQYVWYIVI